MCKRAFFLRAGSFNTFRFYQLFYNLITIVLKNVHKIIVSINLGNSNVEEMTIFVGLYIIHQLFVVLGQLSMSNSKSIS